MKDLGGAFYIPVELAELLHATLGPLADVLDGADHPWVPMIRKVLSEYTSRRDGFLVNLHGEDVLREVAHQTFLAAERVCGMTLSAISEEEDFAKWAEEVTGEQETA